MSFTSYEGYMPQSVFWASIKFVLLDVIGDFFYFPIWWYTRGLIKVARFSLSKIVEQENRLGIRVNLINLFRPMYGQQDWQGKIISFFMRVFLLIFRFLAMLIYLIIILILFILWLVLPPLIVFELLINFV